METFSCSQAARALGVSRNTLLRWFREGRISGVSRDRRGWRSFSETDLDRIRRELGAPAIHDPGPAESQRWARVRAWLQQVPLFRGLPEAVLGELAQGARFQGYLAGQRLFSPGDRSTGLPVLVKGRVRLFRITEGGREQTMAVVTPYQAFGETAVFRPGGQHLSHANCLEGSTVLFVPAVRLRELMQLHPELAFRFLASFSQRLEALEARIEEMALLSLEQRLARHLLSLAGSGWAPGESVEVELTMSTGELASLLGGARESLSRAMMRFRREGLIQGQGRHLLLLDPDALARL